MAEAQESNKPKRRLIKKAESVREQAEKAAASSNQPRRLRKTTRRIGAPLRVVGRGVGRVGNFKPFRILGFILVPPYFRNSWRELRQVTWPTFKTGVRLTTAVLIFAITFGAVVALLDYGLDKVFKEVLLK